MPVGAAIAGSAVVGAGATAYAANKGSKATTQAAQQSNALQGQIYGQNREALSPFMNRGNRAGDTMAGMLGIGSTPTNAFSMFNPGSGAPAQVGPIIMGTAP